MWFLIKGTFWFAMVLVVLSYVGTPEDEQVAQAPGIEIGGAIAAATGAYSYISGLCVEKPDVCVKGAETLTALGQRAKAGAYVAYQILDEKLADTGPSTATVPATELAADGTNAANEMMEAASDAIFTGTVDAGAATAREPLVLHVPVPLRRPGS